MEDKDMRILAIWDDAAQIELLSLYLNVDENQFLVAYTAEEAIKGLEEKPWDAILMSLALPDMETGYELFQVIRQRWPSIPVVGACFPHEVFQLARFLSNGLKSYLLRDAAGDFLFLVQASLESTVAAVRAEREQKIAEKLREEVDSVRKIQETFIPQNLEAPPGYSVVARYEPAQIKVMGGIPVILAGGDYYDVFKLNDHTLVLLVGDASGHGMKACMSIMIMHTLVRMIRGAQYINTAEFVAEINRRLCEHSVVQGEGGFITLLYGVLNSERHEFQWSSAGHPMPLLHHLENDKLEQIADFELAGLPLGVYDDAEYETCTVKIPENSKLVLFTDGLLEAFPANSENAHHEFGLNGTKQTLLSTRQKNVRETLEALFHDSNAFTEGSGRHDDTSVVVLGRE